MWHLSRARPIRFLLAIGILALLVVNVVAQSANPVLAILDVDDSQYPQLKVLVSAADANGIPITGLGKDAFLISEDGHPADILTVQEVSGGTPLHLILALDVSGSMKGEALKATAQAAISLVQGLAATDEIGLILFNDEVQVAVPLTSDHDTVISALQGLVAERDTALYEAAHQGITMLEFVPTGRRAVVLFTDGEDTDSVLTIEDVIMTAQRFSVPLYVVGYGPRIKPDILSRLSLNTGGAFFRAPQLDQIPATFAQVMEILRKGYAITYLGNTPADDLKHEMKVVLSVAGASDEELRGFVARSGNFTTTVEFQDLPERSAAEAVWQAMGEPPVDASVPILSGQVTLAAQSTGPGRPTKVTFATAGTTLAESDHLPFSYVWDTTAIKPGTYTVSCRVEDHVGNVATHEQSVLVIPPAYLSFTAPAASDALDDSVQVKLATASVVGIESVVLSLDGNELKRMDAPPYEYTWTTWETPAGKHHLTATLTTSNGFTTDADLEVQIGQHITVNFTEPTDGESLKGVVRMAAKVESDARVKEVVFSVNDQEVKRLTAPPYQAVIHSGDYLPGEYTYRVEAFNQAGMQARDEVKVQMIPATRTSALGFALVGGLFLLILIPVIFAARRKRRTREQTAVAESSPAPAVVSPATTKKAPVGWLTFADSESPEGRAPLYPGENRIGRNRQFADVWVQDQSVSRRHAVILVNPDGVSYYDLNPNNPSLINDREVVDTVDLHDGDRIQVGQTVLIFHYQSGG